MVRSFILICLAAVLSTFGDEKSGRSILSLAEESDLVVRAKVLASTTKKDRAGRIYTEVELEVLERFKGRHAENPLRLVHPGGILGELATVAAGQPDYPPGEECVLFLTRNAEGKYTTIGLGDGKMTVSSGAASNPALDPPTIKISELRAIFQKP